MCNTHIKERHMHILNVSLTPPYCHFENFNQQESTSKLVAQDNNENRKQSIILAQ